MNLRQLRIGSRLVAGFAVVLASMFVMILVSNTLSTRNRQQMMSGLNLSKTKTALAASMKASLLEGGLAIRNIGLQSDIGEIEKQKNLVKTYQGRFNEARENSNSWISAMMRKS
jgi:methyl-accepting chemotaxis protein